MKTSLLLATLHRALPPPVVQRLGFVLYAAALLATLGAVTALLERAAG